MTPQERLQLKTLCLQLAIQTPGNLMDNSKTMYRWLLKDEEGEAEEQEKQQKQNAKAAFENMTKDLNSASRKA